MKIKTWDLSGMRASYELTCQKMLCGSYELTCQQMLWNAVRFLRSNGKKQIKSLQNENIYGIADNQGEDGKAFDVAMLEGVTDATGAMHHCVTNHALYINKFGYHKWFNKLKESRKDEQCFEYIYDKNFNLEGDQ